MLYGCERVQQRQVFMALLLRGFSGEKILCSEVRKAMLTSQMKFGPFRKFPPRIDVESLPSQLSMIRA